MSEQFEPKEAIEKDKKQFILNKITYQWTPLSKIIFAINTANKDLRNLAENDIASYYQYFVILNEEGLIEDRSIDGVVQIRRKNDFGNSSFFNPLNPGLNGKKITNHKILKFQRSALLLK
jgi:hypothetical protein